MVKKVRDTAKDDDDNNSNAKNNIPKKTFRLFGVHIPVPGSSNEECKTKTEKALRCRRSIKKGTKWTKEEHQNFLFGLKKWGVSNWKVIAENYVKTRTSIQVASHAQKYFKWKAKAQEERRVLRRRTSIFDALLEINIPDVQIVEQSSSPPLDGHPWSGSSSDSDLQIQIVEQESPLQDGLSPPCSSDSDSRLQMGVDNKEHTPMMISANEHPHWSESVVAGSKWSRWTKEEHQKFLFGLMECGENNWTVIAENYVITRTRAQVANHAQSYFERKATAPEMRISTSIFDTPLEINIPDIVEERSSPLLDGHPPSGSSDSDLQIQIVEPESPLQDRLSPPCSSSDSDSMLQMGMDNKAHTPMMISANEHPHWSESVVAGQSLELQQESTSDDLTESDLSGSSCS